MFLVNKSVKKPFQNSEQNFKYVISKCNQHYVVHGVTSSTNITCKLRARTTCNISQIIAEREKTLVIQQKEL